MTGKNGNPAPLPALLWLWAPITIIAAQVAAKAYGEDFYRAWMRGERGIVENLTVLFLVFAAVAGFRLFRLRDGVATRLFGPFAMVMAVGCIFFAGEEASWGQHWLGFDPPEFVAARNDQGELNWHNDPFFEKLLDQLPRNLLTLAALVGGVIGPLVRRSRRRDFAAPTIGGWIWPTYLCLPSALGAVLVSLPEKIFEATRGDVPYLLEISAGETKEFCLALFLMVYLVTLRRQLAARGGSHGALETT